MMICPVCGASSLRPNCEKTYPYAYRGQTTMLSLHGAWCPDCDEMIMDDNQARELEEKIAAFKREVNSKKPVFHKLLAENQRFPESKVLLS